MILDGFMTLNSARSPSYISDSAKLSVVIPTMSLILEDYPLLDAIFPLVIILAIQALPTSRSMARVESSLLLP